MTAAAGRPRHRLRLPGIGVWILAALAYLPALTARAGRMPADTKVYLYLDPGELLANASLTWDTSQFAGWVPHQIVAYLWPTGPWYWLFDALGVPDWVAHRLWIGTILFLGGLGVRWAGRHLGLDSRAALAAGLVYQLSPYVLPYVSRTSVMLLPWAGVGWLVGLTVRACTRTRWRDAALFALVVLTVGAVNATALALVAPAPLLWILHTAWQRRITWRRALVTSAKLGGLSLAVSLWWIVMLWVQGRHGADVLSFSESLEAVSLTSVSTETLRGLGYWLFYVRDPWGFTTTASIAYMETGRVIAAGYALTVIGLLGITLTRWSQRRYAALVVFTGIVLAVGVHPIGNPSPLMSPVEDSALGLALRSSTRALPLSTFGLALGTGALVTALGAARPRAVRRLHPRLHGMLGVAASTVVAVLAVVQMPALRNEGFIDPALERDQDPPPAWEEAVAALDATSSEYRVLQLPGSEFGAYRWGYTVDPPLPGLTGKPLVTRDLLPLGSAGAMDLLYALDNRLQMGTLEPDAIAPVARLLAADTIWLSNDQAYDRFRTPQPEVVAAIFAAVPPGLGPPVGYGDPVPNTPVLDMVDVQWLVDPRIGTPLHPVELAPVTDPVPVVRAATEVVVVAGSGDGLVDAAASGLIDGDEAIFYAADLAEDELDDILGDGLLIATDSNRDRALHWRSSQDVTGMTEAGGPGADVSVEDEADERLAVFEDAAPEEQTTAALDGGLVVRASAYGEPAAYRPEARPAMAVDGDPATAWVVADRADPRGESIELSRTDGELVLLQPQGRRPNRAITEVEVAQPGLEPVIVALTDASRTAPGQVVPVAPDVPVTITIMDVRDAEGTDTGPSPVGFAELGPVAQEVVRVPSATLAEAPADQPVAILLTRERVRATNRWRSDPEPTLVRELALGTDRTLDLTVTLRLEERAPDAILNALAGLPDAVAANRRLTGVPSAAGSSAIDGDPTTAWTTPFGEAIGSELTIPLDGLTEVSSLELVQPRDDLHSTITRVRVAIGGTEVERDVVTAEPGGARASTISFPAASGDELRLTIIGVESRTTRDRRYGELVELPAAVVEIGGLGAARRDPVPVPVPPCRADLLAIDGEPVPLAVGEEVVGRLLAGEAVEVTGCEGATVALASGSHRITGSRGGDLGIDVDRVLLRSGSAPAAPPPPAVDVARERTDRAATVGPCPGGCWLVFGEGYNPAWTAAVEAGGDLESLGEPRQVSGGFNGWWLPPSGEVRTVVLQWPPQDTFDAALALSVAAILLCLGLVVLDRRRTRSGAVCVSAQTEGSFVRSHKPSFAAFAPVSRRAAVASAVVLVVAAGLVIAPLWALIALAPAAAVVVLRRPLLLGLGAAGLAAWLGATVLRRELANRYFLNAGWTAHFEDLHRAGVFVVVLLLAACIVSEPATRGRDPG